LWISGSRSRRRSRIEYTSLHTHRCIHIVESLPRHTLPAA
jgi:hypothetical protein